MIQSELICGGEDQTHGPISLGYRRKRIVPSRKSRKEIRFGNGEKILLREKWINYKLWKMKRNKYVRVLPKVPDKTV